MGKIGAGRPKGSQNVITAEIKQMILQLAQGEVETIKAKLHEVALSDPAKYVGLMIRLMGLILPRPVELTTGNGEGMQINLVRGYPTERLPGLTIEVDNEEQEQKIIKL